MEIIVHSTTKQEFNGVMYYLCGFYFQRNGKRLHREVWKYYNGKIPKGMHIHHKDGNRFNNQISNLELQTPKGHVQEHFKRKERLQNAQKNMREHVIPAAALWHATEEGKKWHSKQAKEVWRKRNYISYHCTYCEKEYKTKHIYGKGQHHFCSSNCRAAYGRKKRRESKCA